MGKVAHNVVQSACVSSPVVHPAIERYARRIRPQATRRMRPAYVTFRDLKSAAAARPPAEVAHNRLAWQRSMAVFAATALLCVCAVMVVRWLAPDAAADASPYFAVNVKSAASTPVEQWSAGTLPHLFQGDESWSNTPYGFATLEAAGSAPLSLAMAYVQQTGDTTLSPVDFAAFASDRDLTANDVSTMEQLIGEAADNFGLEASSIEAAEPAIRQALGHGYPVIVITKPATFSALPICIVLSDVNANHKLDIVDPSNAMRTNESWAFDDIINASAALYSIRAIGDGNGE